MATRKRKQSHGRSPLLLILLGGVVAAAAVLGAAIALSAGGEESPTGSQVTHDGAIQAGGIAVLNPWADMGRLPLDTPVEHRYTLRNVSQQPVSLQRASIEVLEGC